MDNNFLVFVVDDDELMRDMVADLLSDDCTVETFSSAIECLNRIESVQPDMFLLDVTMPEMDGYDLCRYLKEEDRVKDVPVTFISANDSADARLLGYEAGGEDFITKPFAPDELLRKVEVARRIVANKRALHAQAGQATQAAMSVMSTMSEMGTVLQFLSKSFSYETPREVGKALLEVLQSYDLLGAVQLRVGNDTLTMSQNGDDLPLEISVLNNVRNSGRIFQFKSRCAFNCDHVTLMVNNLPIEDEDRQGRFRDHLAILAEGADSRLKAIETELTAQHRHAALLEVLPRVNCLLDSMQQRYRDSCKNLSQTMIAYQEDLLRSFATLGLEQSQEIFLADLAQDHMQRLVAAQDANLEVVAEFKQVADTLAQATSH